MRPERSELSFNSESLATIRLKLSVNSLLPKLAKRKLRVSLILRKPNTEITVINRERMIEMGFRINSFFLKRATKVIKTARKIAIAIAMTVYLVGKILKRKILMRSAESERIVITAKTIAVILRTFLGLVDLPRDCFPAL